METRVTGRRRGPYAKSAERRRSIVDAAFDVFAARGYHGGSLQEVADRVGMSQTSLLHHFPTKRHLLVAVLDRRDEIDGERLPEEEAHDFPSALVRRARINEATPSLIELYSVLCGEAMTEGHPARDYFTARFAGLRTAYADQLRELRDQGRLRSGTDPERAAATIIAMWDGLQDQWLLDPAIDMAGCLADYLALIILPER
ncbi:MULTISPECIES: TetR/AcrR family transcriptional regulator [unclassified Pseudactinotalea]|uniref:TetR/AcrR family transcriptional regulator n=1 Tax=unclassified Pseudactinotalea TaxID=2649176 RepID=UPI00128CC088|nr:MULTISPECIES: TetR/AcrR family transcriptional regulator [unclassified Pseudactinotalea]MPV49209.1 TetR family transcriptional regulator [Pseudactinotalea sp. HY160]QGH68118.1 TetR family transcriptional regulator [Pseudactinotalea sp. HY158]